MTPVSILGYQVSVELYNGSRTVVYRAVREIDQKPVVIKLLKILIPVSRNWYNFAISILLPKILTHL